ncbi:tyrosine-type recombinase/integrase [Entomomonas asaccharolytica]|uniref:tyrosine-type recombinase/integrase n=1 Tax=Entomomonas asaccharolytica TaxID=2785331 RepID=UPI001F2BFE7F|nr:site-specific integrase [Entomomonas asaccharolytica]
MARVVFSLLRQMFRFALDRDLVDQDPTATIRKSRAFGKDNERDRVLTEDEIKILAKAIPNASLLLTTEAAIWITLGTCCRIGELLIAQWQHIDFTKRTWTIPAEHSKNGNAHTIFLSDFVVEQFQQIHSINGKYKWCYPNSKKDNYVNSKTITKQLTDRQRNSTNEILTGRTQKSDSLLLPNGKWTPHDLRRTGATIMTSLGVLPEVAERCLNHIEENKIKRTYQRYSYSKEMTDAWNKLGSYIHKLLLK